MVRVAKQVNDSNPQNRAVNRIDLGIDFLLNQLELVTLPDNIPTVTSMQENRY